jgi:hypothetical protein
LFLHDFIETWYKTNISSKNDFCQDIRLAVHNIIRYLTLWYFFFKFFFCKKNLQVFYVKFSMKNIDWETFILNTLANNFVLHMRIYKKAKEKLKNEKQNGANTINNSNLNSTSNTITNDDLNLIEMFFDVEADIEKGICRDEISQNSNGKEQGIFFIYK